ncbi:cysteine synthase A [Acidipropionibacterium virtanenii]|uniref:Cysteine synthase n=1 Tax=Acidipropionibacterium virtanenii TaxID=2057246 RepID=A0A344UUS3_9ACTN|nr:cysteine synthase A [Acidipropionibacterium virtanenii]AXE39021.1 O-acetylserine sulfhydrylase [Acidipropionibacterium virtanenii]
MAKIAKDITETIGGTPLVRINRLFPDSKATILAKLEFFNPASSVKDRIARSIVDAAEESGALKPGGTIVEATSGNTGIGLALVGAARGYRVIITMPETMSKERRSLVRLLGAELVLTPGADGVPGANVKAGEIVKETPGSILASQFDNPANPEIHYARTGEEIWEDTDGSVDILLAGIGTGGTVSGAGHYLKEKNPQIKVIGAEPAESPVITKGQKAPHKIQGWGPGFVPENLDRSVVDEILLVPGDEAVALARRAASEEGIITGISGGGALQAAGQLAARPENAGKTIVAIIADTAERYQSTALYEGLLD